MSIEEQASIEGTLLMLDDATPHVAVPVQAMCDGEVIVTVLSDERGRYQFANLKSGEYRLRCQILGGYVYYGNDEVSLDESQAISLHIKCGRALKNVDFYFPQFKKGTWRIYTTKHGLPTTAVGAIHKDPAGNMWIGTGGFNWELGNGVCRFNGTKFDIFTVEDGLAGNTVWSIHSETDGMLWFGTQNGVSRYDGKRFTNITVEDGLAGNIVYAIHQEPDGTLWFGTDSGISRYDKKQFINFTEADGLAHNRVYSIYQESDGTIWFGTRDGVSQYNDKGFTGLPDSEELNHSIIFDIDQHSDGSLWFGTNNGIFRYNGQDLANFTSKDGFPGDSVRVLRFDQNGILWFNAFGKGGSITRYDGKTFVNYTHSDGLIHLVITDIHFESDGSIWFASVLGGICRYDEAGFSTIDSRDGLPIGHYAGLIQAIYRDHDNVIWIGTGDGVFQYNPGHIGRRAIRVFTTDDGLPNNMISSIEQSNDGAIWFGSTGLYGYILPSGVSRYDGESITSFTTEDGLVSGRVFSILQTRDGYIWITARGGVSQFNGQEFVNFTSEDGLIGTHISSICQDDEGNIWFGSWFGGGISHYDGKEFTNFTTAEGLADNSISSIFSDHDGLLWFGTCGGGVSHYDGKEFTNFGIEDGLADNFVTVVHRDNSGIMWFGTRGGGVSGYDGFSWTSLDTRDGLKDDMVFAIYEHQDGVLWFGTHSGITQYRRSSDPPVVSIFSITTDRLYTDLSVVPAFTPNTRVTIECNSIDFKTIPEKRQYRCRIREIDSDWRRPTRSDTFDFIFDEPGTYIFEVQAIDRDLNYSEPASVKLEVISDPRNHRIIQLEAHIREQELAEMERVHQELVDARQIQQSLLPERSPVIEGFDIAGVSKPAREVSGDFYNYLSLGDSVGIVLADVTGKSVKAAMVAALANGTLNAGIRDQRNAWSFPSIILEQLNRDLHPHLISGMFVAMSLGIIQPDRKRLIFSNAGMPYPIFRHGNKAWELEVNGMPLGLIDNVEYDDMVIDLEVNDLITFCSDGVIEAMNKADEMYQTERLLGLVKQADTDISAQGMVDLIVNDVAEFSGDVELSDDMTIVVIRCVA